MILVPPLRGYGCDAPLGLRMFRPSGAVNVPPRWGYGCGVLLGLLMFRPAGAMDEASLWVTDMSPLWGVGLLRKENAEPRRGDLSIERREMILHLAPAGRHTHSPSGAAYP
jgi:hypothetical protein